jgi:hypothetical protein
MNILFLLLVSLSAFAQPLLARLTPLYSHQSQDLLKERIKLAETPIAKWRAFPSLFFAILSQDQEFKKYTGPRNFCMGDVHAENFGSLVSSSGLAVYGLNDLDDADKCFSGLDYLRMTISWSFFLDEKTLLEVLTSMKRSMPEPLLVTNLLEKARKNGTNLAEDEEAFYQTGKCEKDLKEPEPADKMEVLKIYPEAKKVCQRVKLSGGSGGLKRFWVSLGSSKVMELKQIVNSGISFYRQGKTNRTDRIQKAMREFWPSHIRGDYQVRDIKDETYLIRPKYKGQETLELKKLSEAEKLALAQYQFTLLRDHHPRYPSDLLGQDFLKMALRLKSEYLVLFAE